MDQRTLEGTAASARRCAGFVSGMRSHTGRRVIRHPPPPRTGSPGGLIRAKRSVRWPCPPDLAPLRVSRLSITSIAKGRRSMAPGWMLRTLEAIEALLSKGSALQKSAPVAGAVVVSTKVSKTLRSAATGMRRLIHGWMQNLCRVWPEPLSGQWLLFSLSPAAPRPLRASAGREKLSCWFQKAASEANDGSRA